MSDTHEIEVRDLRFEYGKRSDAFTLSTDSLEVDPGEALALVGPSGSGKSTLLSLMGGLLLPDHGRVAFEGQSWSELGEAQRRSRRISRIGLIFQEFELLPHLSVEENVLLPYFIHPDLRLDGDARQRCAGLLAESGIERYARTKPRDLSQGERQRVALCRALVTQPALVLADEPTGNLDPTTSRSVLELLMESVQSRGSSLIMVTHDHTLLEAFPRVVDLGELAHSSAGKPE